MIARGEPPCWLCGKPIDYEVKYPNPSAYVIDHVMPLARGGTDTLDNLKPAHAGCNNRKRTRTDGAGIIKRSGSYRLPTD